MFFKAWHTLKTLPWKTKSLILLGLVSGLVVFWKYLLSIVYGICILLYLLFSCLVLKQCLTLH